MDSKLINISVELKPDLSHTEKSCISKYFRQFSTNIKIITKKLKSELLKALANKTGSNLIILCQYVR